MTSGTAGLLRAEAVMALLGCDLLIYAGDVGVPEDLVKLRALAPAFAVRGNVDRAAWAESLPTAAVVEAGPHQLYVLHNRKNVRGRSRSSAVARRDYAREGRMPNTQAPICDHET